NGFATRRFRTGFRVSARVHPLFCGAVSEPRRLQRADPAARFAHGVDIGAWFGRLSRRPVDRSVALADGESRVAAHRSRRVAEPFRVPSARGRHAGEPRATGARVLDRRHDPAVGRQQGSRAFRNGKDRKSTRLNSSHVSISYAVFCLKKKKEIGDSSGRPRSRTLWRSTIGLRPPPPRQRSIPTPSTPALPSRPLRSLRWRLAPSPPSR